MRLAYERVESLGCHDFIIAIRDGEVEVSYERRCPDCGVDFLPREVALREAGAGAAFWRNPTRALAVALNKVAEEEAAIDRDDWTGGLSCRSCRDIAAPSERHPEAGS